MAADPNDVINQFVAALERLESRLGQSASRVQGTIDAYSQLRSATSQMTQAGRATAEAMRGMTRDTNAGRSAIQAKARFERTVTGELSQLSKAVARGSLTHAEGDEAFRQMIASVRQNVDLSATQRRDLMQTLILERRKQDALARAAQYTETFNKYLGPAGNVIQQTASAYQSGSFALASFMGKQGLLGATGMLDLFGKGLMSLGGLLASRGGGIGKVLGGIATGLGVVMSSAAEKAKVVIAGSWDFLSAETQKLIATYQDLSRAGVVFGNGIDGMNAAAADAGLSSDRLAAVIKNNSESIAMAGIGMTEGTKQIARIGKVLREDKVTEKLVQLGYSIDEVTSITAQTMGQMRMGGGNASDQEIADYTKQYAKDLKVLSAITGEDVRQKDKEAKAKANTLAFNQKLLEMEPKQRTAMLDSLQGLTSMQQQAFRERVINDGQLMTKETMMAESQIDGMEDHGKAIYDAHIKGTLNLGRVTDLNREYAERMTESIKNQKEIGLAAELGVESVSRFAQTANEILQRVLKTTGAATDNAKDNVEQAFSERVGKTTEELGKVVVAAEKMHADMAKLITDSGVITLFAKAINATTTAIDELARAIGTLTGRSPPPPSPTPPPPSGGTVADRSLPRVDPNTGAPFLGTADRPMTVNDPALIEAIRNTRPPGGQAPGLASGGLVDFPTTGSLAVLHGQEAVIPLPSGLRAEDLADVFKSLKEGLSEKQLSENQMDEAHPAIDRLFKEYKVSSLAQNESLGSTQEDMVKQLFELNTSMNTLIDHMRDVSNHTERTARGVA